METPKAYTQHSTIIISDRFAERRAQLASQHPEPPPAEPLEPGNMVGRYLILSRIGGGGMGVVYRAHDTELNRTVAIKVLPPHLCKNADYLKRFRTEAQAQARLNSPHIVTLYSMVEHPAGLMLVLEYVQGQTLESRLRGEGSLSAREAVKIFEQTLRGVEHIHHLGVVHRDLKPSNLFITQQGKIKLMDFGVARIMDSQDPSQIGTMVGTLLYISPEQINGKEIDFRSDIYTLGISLFEAVTGRLPFERRTDYELMHAHVQETPPRPKKLQRRLTPALERIILKAIEKDPSRRYQSAAEFRSALLDLGLVERRRKTQHTTPINNTAEIDSPHPKKKWINGAWFDAGLMTTVAVLALTLGLYPANKLTNTGDQMETARLEVPSQKISTAAKYRNTGALAVSPIRQGQTAPSKLTVKASRQEKYKSLKQAWGG